MNNSVRTKAQSAFEFMSTYAWALLILAILVVGLYVFVLLPGSAIPARCSFEYAITCEGISVGTNTVGTYINIELINGQTYDLAANSTTGNTVATVEMGSYGTGTGTCTPTNVISGGTMLCYIAMPKKVPLGTNVGGTIYLNSSICLEGPSFACETLQKVTYTGNFTTTVSGQTHVVQQSYIYEGSSATGANTITGPSGSAYSYYICVGSESNGYGLTTTNWNPADIQMPATGVFISASVGHLTSSSTCTIYNNVPYIQLDSIAELSVGASSPTKTTDSFYNPSSSQFSYSVTSPSSFVVIAVSCGDGSCSQILLPAACDIVAQQAGDAGGETVMIAVCASQAAGTQTVTVTNEGGYVAEAAYNFGSEPKN